MLLEKSIHSDIGIRGTNTLDLFLMLWCDGFGSQYFTGLSRFFGYFPKIFDCFPCVFGMFPRLFGRLPECFGSLILMSNGTLPINRGSDPKI